MPACLAHVLPAMPCGPASGTPQPCHPASPGDTQRVAAGGCLTPRIAHGAFATATNTCEARQSSEHCRAWGSWSANRSAIGSRAAASAACTLAHSATLPTWCQSRCGMCCRCTGCTGHCQAATPSSWWLLSPGGTPHTLSCLKARGSEATYCGSVVQKVAQQGRSCTVQRGANNLWSTCPGQRHCPASTHLCAGRSWRRCTVHTVPGCWRGAYGFPHPRRRPRPCRRAQSQLGRKWWWRGSSPCTLRQGGSRPACLLSFLFNRQLAPHQAASNKQRM